MTWIGLYRPTERELGSLAAEFGLHELAVEDAILAHQRPKLERYGDTLFVVLRAARYLDDLEEVDFGELHIFVGPTSSSRPSWRGAGPVRSATGWRTIRRLLARGPEAVLYAILDAVVDGYARSSPGCRTTSTRSRPRCFAATRRCRGASTSCPAKSSSSSARPGR